MHTKDNAHDPMPVERHFVEHIAPVLPIEHKVVASLGVHVGSVG